jgi:hypothetical protein
VAAVVTGGCATLPTSGQVRSLSEPQSGLTQSEDFPQLIPAPPGKDWRPEQIVSGFLAASASFAGGYAIARKYLVPRQARTWKPGGAVTVVSQAGLQVTHLPVSPRVTGQSASDTARVVVTGQELATLTPSGQYKTPQASSKQVIHISLKLLKIRDQWRVVNPPLRLLLTKSDFLRVYQPRNLYFFVSPGGTLVPDPVFVPLQATTTVLAADLVRALRQSPVGWLGGATHTGFPRGTRPLGVRIEGTGAIVNLGGTIARAGPGVIADVAAQLVWTLTSPSYGRSAISWVRLEINGRSPSGSAGQEQLLRAYADKVPAPSAGGGLYFVGKDGAVQVLSQQSAASPSPVHGQAGTGLVPMTSIAVSPTQGKRFIAGVSPGGKVIRFGTLVKDATLRSWRPGGRITSLSWDRSGDLWVAAGNGVWLRRPGGKAPVAVDVGQLRAGDRVTALRIAPDGVRIAVIVRGKSGSQVKIGAVVRGAATASIVQLVPIGAGISDPVALSWYDADDLMVLATTGSAGGQQLERVPVNGGQPVTFGRAEPHTISLTTAGSQIVAGLRGGQMATLSGAAGGWGPRVPGEDPAYPG